MMLKQLKRMGLLVLTCAVSLFTISLCAFAKPDWPLDTGCQSEAGIVMDMDSGVRFICPEYPCAEIPRQHYKAAYSSGSSGKCLHG